MAADFLEKIVAYKQSLLADRVSFYENLKTNINKAEYTHYHLFHKALARPGQVNLIAEIKKASPSRGVIREEFNVEELAGVYEKNGAAAISVLTEDKYFLGKPAYLSRVSDLVHIPTLMKDFIIHEYQIYEAVSCGASAILLIVAILEQDTLKDLMVTAHRLGLDCLIEIHDEAELRRAVDAGAPIIGINNRNLATLQVDLSTSERLVPKVPAGTIVVAESGLDTHADIQRLKKIGVNAVLIGESFMKEADVAGKIKEVMYGQSQDLRDYQS